MSDRELLELAAKAAGIKFTVSKAWHDTGAYLGDGDYWNPLEDDSDAFRLLVRLGLFWNPEFSHYLALERFAGQERDDCHAHRRAVVRAAAALATQEGEGR